MTNADTLPHLSELGPDLTRLSRRQRLTTVVLPFACAAGYFALAAVGWWLGAFLACVPLSFFTYGSTSHDLVHRSLGLPRRWNDWLLCLTELLAVRSGHAYRAAHLHHHARYPAEDDIEGAAARMTLLGSIRDGFTLQARMWRWALRRGRDRAWVVGEGAACLLQVAGALALLPLTTVPAVYVGLMVAGSWVIPLATSYLPHDPRGDSELTRTRAFRGRVTSAVALGHLYHLEHHLYPAVPHQNWPELARRLDPHLERAGVRAVRWWF